MDLRLTPEQIKDAIVRNTDLMDDSITKHQAVADAATRHAIGEIDELLMYSIRREAAFWPIWAAIKKKAGIEEGVKP